MILKRLCITAVLFCAGTGSIASALYAQQQQDSGKPATVTAKPIPPQPSAHDADEGQRVFEQNCSRCHNTPDSFPPQISGTVVRHMRVRANLSDHDEKVLMKFFNP